MSRLLVSVGIVCALCAIVGGLTDVFYPEGAVSVLVEDAVMDMTNFRDSVIKTNFDELLTALQSINAKFATFCTSTTPENVIAEAKDLLNEYLNKRKNAWLAVHIQIRQRLEQLLKDIKIAANCSLCRFSIDCTNNLIRAAYDNLIDSINDALDQSSTIQLTTFDQLGNDLLEIKQLAANEGACTGQGNSKILDYIVQIRTGFNFGDGEIIDLTEDFYSYLRKETKGCNVCANCISLGNLCKTAACGIGDVFNACA